MEPPSTVLDDYFSRGIALILILLVYALISGVDYAFRTQNEPSSDKTGGKHLPEALMLFLLLFKIAVIILSSSLLALIYAVPLAFTLMLAAEGAAIHLISGHEKSFLKKCYPLIWFICAIASPLSTFIARFSEMGEDEKEDRDAKGNKSYMKTKSSVTRSFPLENYVDPAGYDISEQRDKLVIKFKKNTQIKNKKTVNARKEDYI